MWQDINIIETKGKKVAESKGKKIAIEKKGFMKGLSGLPKQLDVHYIKADAYRTYYADGIFGGLTPNGKIYVELFVQRQPTPQIVQYAVEKDGNLGKELKRVGKEGLIREIETGIVMDVQTARVFKKWLEERIKDFEEQTDLVSKNSKGQET